jgi:hypothetical protein
MAAKCIRRQSISGITGDSIYARNDSSPAIFKFAKRVFDEINFKPPQ